MNNKLLIGIIAVIVGLVIAAAILKNPVWAMTIPEVALVGIWIYLVGMVWKKKTNIFHDQMEPKLAERRLKRLKTFLLVAGISFAMFWVSVFPLRIVLAVISNQPEEGGVVVFWIAYSSVVLFTIATIGGLYIFLKGRRKTT